MTIYRSFRDKYAKLDIKSRLVSLIAIMSAFLILAGLMGFYISYKENRRLEDLYQNRLLSVKWLNAIRANSRANEANIYKLMLVSNPLIRKQIADNYKKRTNEWRIELNQYKTKPKLDPFERSQLSAIQKTSENYLNIRNKAFILAYSGKKQEALDYYLSRLNQLNGLNIRIRNLAEYNSKMAEIEYKTAVRAAMLGYFFIFGSIFLGLILIVSMGIFIINSIRQPLSVLVDKMCQVAKGNLDVEPVKYSYENEIGDLNNSFNVMKQNLHDLFYQEQLARERQNLLLKIIQTIRESLDIDEILPIVCAEVSKMFNVQRVSIVEVVNTNDSKDFYLRCEHKINEDIKGLNEINNGDIDKNKSMAYWTNTVYNQGIAVINNVGESDIPDYFKRFYEYLGVKASIGAAVQRGDEKWGTLVLTDYDNYRDWTQDEISLLKIISSQLYIAIRQAELYLSVKKSVNTERILRTINNEILTSDSLNNAVERIVFEIGKRFNVDMSSIRFFDPHLREFSEVKAEYRRNEQIPSALGKVIPMREFDDYLSEHLLNTRSPMVIKDINDPKYPDFFRIPFTNLGIYTTIIIPVIYKDELLAAIFLTNTELNKPITEIDLDLVHLIAQQVSIGINLFESNENLNRSLNSERTVRDIIVNARKYEEHDKVYNYLLEKIQILFNADRVLHFHYEDNPELLVKNEFISNKNLEPLINQQILSQQDVMELNPKGFGEIVTINNVDTEISNELLRNYLKSKGIEAFLTYPSSRKLSYKDVDRILSITMVCSSSPKKWTSNEINSFKLVVDTALFVYLEILQKQETDELRRTFLATLTHDLRSPIIAEQKALEFILSREPETTLKTFSEFLEDIYKTNEELLRIVNNILSVYHYESGKFELKSSLNNICNIIDDVVRLMAPLAKDQDSHIIINLAEGLPMLNLDKDEITRVMVNLISNAIKHNTRGTNIEIKAIMLDNEIKVSVKDNGKGIPESEKQNIFQRYPTTKRKIGTGLGLYLSKQIIEAHNGRIWFETEEGKGTTFSFTLPLLKDTSKN